MSSELLPLGRGGLMSSRLDRQVERASARIDAESWLAVRRDQRRIERLVRTTELGVAAAAHIALVEEAQGELGTAFGRAYAHQVALAGVVGIAAVVQQVGWRD